MEEPTIRVEAATGTLERILERLDALEQRVSWTQEQHETWSEARRREIDRVAADLEAGLEDVRRTIRATRDELSAAQRRAW